jgi:hypothetical protein
MASRVVLRGHVIPAQTDHLETLRGDRRGDSQLSLWAFQDFFKSIHQPKFVKVYFWAPRLTQRLGYSTGKTAPVDRRLLCHAIPVLFGFARRA